jgi:hypothetical protein
MNPNIIIEEGMEECPNCHQVVKIDQIYSTHEDEDDPENVTYCELCQNKATNLPTKEFIKLLDN